MAWLAAWAFFLVVYSISGVLALMAVGQSIVLDVVALVSLAGIMSIARFAP